jgi:hypothetical protein
MLPIPPEYQILVGIAVALVFGFGAVFNFFRGIKAPPPAHPNQTALQSFGAAFGDRQSLEDIAQAIRESHVSRGELINEVRNLSSAIDRLAREIEDGSRNMRR